MGKPKASDEQIMRCVSSLKLLKAKGWAQRFGSDLPPFTGCQREEIQELLYQAEGITYSTSGMRGRLKALVDDGTLEKFRIGGNTVYYL